MLFLGFNLIFVEELIQSSFLFDLLSLYSCLAVHLFDRGQRVVLGVAGTKRLEDSERAQIHRLFYCPSLDSMYLFHSIFISKASYSSIPFSSLKALLISYSGIVG